MGENTGASPKPDGAAEMVGASVLCGDDEANDEQLSAIKAKNTAQSEQKEAMNDHRINAFIMK